MTFSSGLRVAVATTAGITAIAAGVAPVPGLPVLAALVDGILKLCDDVRMCKCVRSMVLARLFGDAT